jgi:hypothetical protein
MMPNEDDIREQIRRAVEEARAAARARAMEGGYYDHDEEDYEGGYAYKRASNDPENVTKRTLYKKRTTYKGQKVKAKEGKVIRKVNSSGVLLKDNPRYRTYIAVVRVNGAWVAVANFVERKGKQQRVFHRFHGTPAAAARKVMTSLGGKKLTAGLGTRGRKNAEINPALAPATDAVRDGETIELMLVEITRGVRKTHVVNGVRRSLASSTGQNHTTKPKYFTYRYFARRVPTNEIVVAYPSYTKKNGEVINPVAHYEHKNVVMRAKAGESLADAARRYEVRQNKSRGSDGAKAIAEMSSAKKNTHYPRR